MCSVLLLRLAWREGVLDGDRTLGTPLTAGWKQTLMVGSSMFPAKAKSLPNWLLEEGLRSCVGIRVYLLNVGKYQLVKTTRS